jgi:hypothetical protein
MRSDLSDGSKARLPLPALIVAADWSASASKRWLFEAVRQRDGRYELSAPRHVGESRELVDRLGAKAGLGETVLLGFDFPIGLPGCYATRVGIKSFRAGLAAFGRGNWPQFYQVTDQPTPRQPFGSRANDRGGLRRHQLAEALGLTSEADLYRACERRTPTRGKAEALFFTRFAKQVGRAAIHGWQEVLQPAGRRVRIWPFDGSLQELLTKPGVVVAEIYPAEATAHLGLGLGLAGRGKARVENRRAAGRVLARIVRESGHRLSDDASRQLVAGFPTDDAFDAFVGARFDAHGRRRAVERRVSR